MSLKSAVLAAATRLHGYAKFLRSADVDQIMWRLQTRMRGLDFQFVAAEDLGADRSRVNHYGDTGCRLRSVLKVLARPRSDEAVDIGCGKAGAVLTLSQYFARADGIDISAELVSIGRENLRRMRVQNSSLFVCDAAEFRDLDRYRFIYLANPFPQGVMEDVVRNILASLARCPRQLELLYMNPRHAHVLEAAGFHRDRVIRPNEAGMPADGQEPWGTFVSYSWHNLTTHTVL